MYTITVFVKSVISNQLITDCTCWAILSKTFDGLYPSKIRPIEKSLSSLNKRHISLSPPPPSRMKRARVLLKPSLLLPSCLARATTIFSSASQSRLLSNLMEMNPSSDSSRYCYDPVLRWDPQVEDYFNKAYGPDHFARISKALTYLTFFPSFFFCLIASN